MTAEQPASDELGNPAFLADALMQLTDRAMRMEVALRLVRHFAMSGVLQPESGAVRDWLRDWIDGIYGSGGPGGPLLWPAALANCCQLMRGWGFEPSARDENGLSYVVLKRQPEEGEAVQ